MNKFNFKQILVTCIIVACLVVVAFSVYTVVEQCNNNFNNLICK